MIKSVSVWHTERDYFGSKTDFESTMTYLYEDKVLKAVDKFFRRSKECPFDVLKIATESGMYVIFVEQYVVKWYYLYGVQNNKSATKEVSAREVKKMVLAEFART